MNILNNLELERKRLIFRASHRGIKEMDYILGHFVHNKINDFNEAELKDLQYIMSFEDRDLLSWFMGEVPLPKNANIPMFHNILKFHNIKV